MVELIDLSGYIEEDQPVYPGNQPTQFWTGLSHEGSAYEWRQKGYETDTILRKEKAKREGGEEEHPISRTMLISEHGPTHVDALTHLDPTEDRSIDEMSLDWFYGPAVGVDVSHVGDKEFITVDDLKRELDDHDLTIQDGDAITLHTGHREQYYAVDDIEKRYAYLNEHPGLDEEAAYWLADQGVKNIGIDAGSIDHSDATETQEFPAHDMCAERSIINMEHMANLDAVAGMRYTLCAFPLKIRDGTGSPIRPVAIVGDE